MPVIYTEAVTLARDLGRSVESLYALSRDVARHYKAIDIPKHDGGVRRLYAPDGWLKGVQRDILDNILVHLPISPQATAYRYGGGILPNARPHAGRRAVLRLDIKGFFDAVTFAQVKGVFPAGTFAEPLRVLLAILCYRVDRLPQGAPTSPYITNLILRDFDLELAAWCHAEGIAYTRYCDDLTFSWDGQVDPAQVIHRVSTALGRMGFYLNPSKTRLSLKGTRQQVTGLVVNEGVAVPREYRRRLRQEAYYCQRYGVESHLKASGSDMGANEYLLSLMGRLGHLLAVTPEDRWARDALDAVRGIYFSELPATRAE